MPFKNYLICLLLGTLLFACSADSESEMREQVIQEKLEERIAKYKSDKRKSCQKKVLQKAGAIADSILLREARLKRDTSDRPGIPDKPEVPEFVPVKDTVPVEPFFRDSTLELIESDSSVIGNDQ